MQSVVGFMVPIFDVFHRVFHSKVYHVEGGKMLNSHIGADVLNVKDMSPECQLAFFTSARSAILPKGLVVFHGGTTARNQFRNKECCFFASLLLSEADLYADSANDQYFGSDPERKSVEIRAYVLLEDVTLYEWYYTDLQAVWGYGGGKPGKEANSAEYEAHNAMARLGIEGKFSSDSEEIMLTPLAYGKLSELHADVSNLLMMFNSRLADDIEEDDYDEVLDAAEKVSMDNIRLCMDYLLAASTFFDGDNCDLFFALLARRFFPAMNYREVFAQADALKSSIRQA